MKILRTWRGWTSHENAPIYEAMLAQEVFPAVKAKGVTGLEKVSIATQELEHEVEFFLTLQFDNLASVKQFAGDDYIKAYIPDNAKKVLSRYDYEAQHYTLKGELVF
ncbi:antibiotic biosynthesis monooxygenase [Sediminicola luteus]|uniref:Antibiotic biosynthesis monooxygenase n=1 Tax=Sediminicola luteus TaxID=319238 RepID=A0A2A4GEA9_9FLAO|nr:antibiotic biosynthesis monooxygenase [Sediminicola luteus]PCE66338.1 antibiotic biosynthesis monooxygenase [Sediminicola luteus]